MLDGLWEDQYGRFCPIGKIPRLVECSYITKDFYQISDCIEVYNWDDVCKLIAQFIDIKDGLNCINNSVIYLHFSPKFNKNDKIVNGLIDAQSLKPVKILNDHFLKLPGGGGYKYNERLIFKDTIESDETISFPVMLYLFRQHFVKNKKENMVRELRWL